MRGVYQPTFPGAHADASWRVLPRPVATAKDWPASRVRPTQAVKRQRGRVSAGSAGPRAVLRDVLRTSPLCLNTPRGLRRRLGV